MRYLIATISGLLFGFGIALSQMIDRGRVLAFMDLAGVWDPTLLLVLAGATGVTIVTFRFVLRMPHPIFESEFHLPTRKEIDKPLVIGSLIFGIGWGVSGYCPGSAIPALFLGAWNPVIFVLAMISGSLAYRWLSNRKHVTAPIDVNSVVTTSEQPL